ncbi:MAG: chemotaxis protein CheB [Pedobacter sp.]|nr:MAG: chemotaxis protein CheB [Pedobacter sp.]
MEKEFYIIGIGASRGGMTALKEFFEHIPADTPAAFIVLTHLNRDRHSILTDLLSPYTQLSIARVDQDVKMGPGNVYVLTENTTLTIENGWLKVSERDSKMLNSSVDIFFKSLATEFKDRAIGIILSGGGKDGLEGALQLAECGGRVMVQNLMTATATEMPEAIIDHDHPAEVLNPTKLAEKVVELCNRTPQKGKH